MSGSLPLIATSVLPNVPALAGFGVSSLAEIGYRKRKLTFYPFVIAVTLAAVFRMISMMWYLEASQVTRSYISLAVVLAGSAMQALSTRNIKAYKTVEVLQLTALLTVTVVKIFLDKRFFAQIGTSIAAVFNFTFVCVTSFTLYRDWFPKEEQDRQLLNVVANIDKNQFIDE